MEQKAKKPATFLFRLTDQEKLVFTERAKEAGLPLTGWMCMNLRKAAAEELEKQGLPNPFVKTG